MFLEGDSSLPLEGIVIVNYGAKVRKIYDISKYLEVYLYDFVKIV